MRHVLATDDTTFRTSKLNVTAMDKVARMQAGRKLAALKKSEKKSIGKSLAEARKQAKMGSVQETPEVCKFVFKGESDILPSKVTKAEVYRSPFQLSRSSRNLQKCGYSSKEEAYTHPGEGYNPFDMYALQNIGTLERFVDICCSHVRTCGCKGKIVFISPRLNDIPTSFRGTLFSIHTA